MRRRQDPVEAVVQKALECANVRYTEEYDERAQRLDFYLPDLKTHIECKRLHAPRILEQMSRVESIIVIQGMDAAVINSVAVSVSNFVFSNEKGGETASFYSNLYGTKPHQSLRP